MCTRVRDILFAALCLTLLAGRAAGAATKKGPGKLELGGAEHRLKKFEDKVRRMRGQPFKLGYVESEALTRVAALHKKHPDHPKVKELFQRARKVYLASKGRITGVKKEWLVYRENEQKLKQLFVAEADRQWETFKAKHITPKTAIAKAFPSPSTRDVSLKKLQGRYVVLDRFLYPMNEFSDAGRQFVFVGSGARGYYYVELSNRGWLGAYEAFKRYRRFVCRDIPENAPWTVVGKVVGVELVIPQAGKKKTGAAHWGWRVEPVALRVPGCTFAVADAAIELGGRFAGEERMDEIKGPLYTVKSVPPDVTPKRLTEIFIAAIKEKNHKLYLDCIDPRRRKTPKGRDLCMYHWEWHQHRFATFYVHVDVGPPEVAVLKGFDESADLETFFLTEDDKAKIKKHAEPLVKVAELRTTAFDERGRQYGSPKPRFFSQTEGGRWYITNYPQPF